jgi:hypothetical protein
MHNSSGIVNSSGSRAASGVQADGGSKFAGVGFICWYRIRRDFNNIKQSLVSCITKPCGPISCRENASQKLQIAFALLYFSSSISPKPTSGPSLGYVRVIGSNLPEQLVFCPS